MPFDQSTLTSVKAIVQGSQYLVTWTSSSPAGTWWQLYIGQQLAWVGQRSFMVLPIPPSRERVDVGAVLPGEEHTNFAYLLPTPPLSYALLSWEGGTFEAADIAGFYVYSSAAPGGAVDYTKILATVTAYPSGIYTDGFGFGGFGDGGFGAAASMYSWTSGQLASGTWIFAIVPFDSNGNSGTASTVSITICAPPSEPSILFRTTRMTYTYSPSTHDATLTWGIAS